MFFSIIFLCGCSSHKTTSNTDFKSSSLSLCSEVVEESENYIITYLNGVYNYCIYDKEHNVVKSDGPLSKKPNITEIDDLIKITVQAGTGKGTQWGYYYNLKTNVFSHTYKSIYDQSGTIVAYGGVNKVIVSDIFDSDKYYCELTNFREPLSVSADPIVSAHFINDGSSIKIAYLSGNKYEVKYEIFDLYMKTEDGSP